MFFWNPLAFLMIQHILTIWSLVPLLFLNPAWTSGSSQFMYCWSLAWRILSITLLACESESEVTQLCPTFCDRMDCSLPGSLHPWNFLGKSTGVGCHFLLQRIFPTQGSNLGFPCCRQMLYHFTVWATREGSMWIECNCAVLWTFFGIAFLWDWMKTDLFQSCGHCWVFQICWHIECSTFTASSFRIWNSSNGIPSPPLALFIMMLSKAHLTSHSRMSGSRWVITTSWFSVSWRSFCRVLCILASPS